MYILIAGGGKVGTNLTSTLLHLGHEVTLIDNDVHRHGMLEERFGNVARFGDATGDVIHFPVDRRAVKVVEAELARAREKSERPRSRVENGDDARQLRERSRADLWSP
jgi:nucleoside-diphosphate-sugar epimerase